MDRTEQDEKEWNRLWELFSPASRLSEDAIQHLERRWADDSRDLEAGVQLLGYYITRFEYEGPHYERAVELSLWFLRHHPTQPYIMSAVFPILYWENAGARAFEVEEIWLQHLESRPADPDILWQSLPYLELFPDKPRELLLRLVALKPDYSLYASSLFEDRVGELNETPLQQKKEKATEALSLWEKLRPQLEAEGHWGADPFLAAARCFLCAGELARSEELAKFVLSRSEWPFFEDSTVEAHQSALHLLGLAALERGWIDESKNYLRKAGIIRFSEDKIPWMYPKLTLAQELLRRGEGEAVCEYLSNYPSAVVTFHLPVLEAIKGIRNGTITSLTTGCSGASRYAEIGEFLARYGKHDRAQKWLRKARAVPNVRPEERERLDRLADVLGVSTDSPSG